MPKHRLSFKIDKFLQAVDPELRKKYFSEKGLKLPANINLKDDSFEEFWDKIDGKKRTEIEEDLQSINDTADETRDCLQQAVKRFKIKTDENESSETTAMRVFLHSDEAFSLAYDLYLYHSAVSEQVSHHKFEKANPDFGQVSFGRFKSEVEKHFKECGKSDNCDIHQIQDGDNEIFLIARADFIKSHLVFEDGKVETRTYRPAKEDVLAFNKKTSILDVHLNGRNEDDRNQYIRIFGKAILRLAKIDEKTFKNILVVLDPIKKKKFNYGGNEHIEAIILTEVRAKVHNPKTHFLTVKSNAIADFLSKYGLSQDGAELVSANLKFLIRRDGKKSRPFSVLIKPPVNSRVPQKTGRKVVEAYLREQGVLLV